MNPDAMRPAHRLWHLVRRTIPPGEPISPPNINAPILTETLRKFPKKSVSRKRIGPSLSVLDAVNRTLCSNRGLLWDKPFWRPAGIRPVTDHADTSVITRGFTDSPIRAPDTHSGDEEEPTPREIDRGVRAKEGLIATADNRFLNKSNLFGILDLIDFTIGGPRC